MKTSQPEQILITAEGLCKSYGDKRVVNDISFAIPRGKCVGFLGPNGAGKTTTLRMLLGLTPPTAGRLTLFEYDIPRQAPLARRRVGVIPQFDTLDPDFTVEENLRIYASYFGLDKKVMEQRIPELLEFAALTERRKEKTNALSGGMRRRLTIARALINQPQLVVLDEPTTGLDPQARHNIWARLSRLKHEGVTLILTTHYMEEAERLCDDIIVIDHGRILDRGSPQDLIARHVAAEVIEIRDHDERSLPLEQWRSHASINVHGDTVYCYTDRPARLLEVLRQHPTLKYLHRPTGVEDVFLKLTGRELRD